jgi:hypothetical protein
MFDICNSIQKKIETNGWHILVKNNNSNVFIHVYFTGLFGKLNQMGCLVDCLVVNCYL